MKRGLKKGRQKNGAGSTKKKNALFIPPNLIEVAFVCLGWRNCINYCEL